MMKLPSLKFSLPFIFICWCIAGSLTHGSVILAYPAMWAVVGLFFYGLHVMIKAPVGTGEAQPADATSESQSPRVPSSNDSPTDHQVSAPV